MNAKELEKLKADPEGFVAALEAKHAEDLKAKDEAHTTALTEKEAAHVLALSTQEEAHKLALTSQPDLSGDKDKAIIKLQGKVDSLIDQLAKSSKEDNRGVVPGTFTSESGKVVKFAKGHTVVKYAGEVYQSADLISDKKLSPVMESLIEIGFGGFEEVKSTKK